MAMATGRSGRRIGILAAVIASATGWAVNPAPAAAQADVEAAWSSGLAPMAISGLSLAARAETPVQAMASTRHGEFVIVTANRPLASPGFPAAIRAAIDALIRAGKTIDVVAVGPRDQWVVIADDQYRQSGIPSAAQQRIASLLTARQTINTFAFSTSDGGWVLAARGQVYSGGRLPSGLPEAIAAAADARRAVHSIAISFQTHWALVAGDWYATDGIVGTVASLLPTLDRFRTAEGRRIDHVVFSKDSPTAVGWAVISNRAEPVGRDRMSQIENGFASGATIFQRLQANGVPGLSLAVVENNTVTWQRSYGLLRTNRTESYVYPNSIFDVASVSKAVSAVGALQLVDAGKLSLSDTTLLDDLVPTALQPAFKRQFANRHDITLNLLLSHCAGVVHATGGSGVESFGASATLPTIIDVIMGTGRASTGKRSVQTSTLLPGTQFMYSGANYGIIQALIDKYSANGFARHMSDLLRDVGMTSSTYTTPPPWQSPRFAWGHGSSGVSNVLAYPNQAAAGLSTTADDLGRFVIMLNQRGSSGGRQVLRSGSVLALGGQQNGANQACANRGAGTRGIMGLGMNANATGTWSHGGTHNGYRAFMFARPGDRWGLIVMMNGGNTTAMARELFGAVEAAYGLTTGTLSL